MKDSPRLGLEKDGLNISGGCDVTFVVGNSGMGIASNVNVDNVNLALGFQGEKALDHMEADEAAATGHKNGAE